MIYSLSLTAFLPPYCHLLAFFNVNLCFHISICVLSILRYNIFKAALVILFIAFLVKFTIRKMKEKAEKKIVLLTLSF